MTIFCGHTLCEKLMLVVNFPIPQSAFRGTYYRRICVICAICVRYVCDMCAIVKDRRNIAHISHTWPIYASAMVEYPIRNEIRKKLDKGG